MSDLSFLERFSAVSRVVFSSPFFIFLFAFMILTIVVFSVYGATKSKVSKIICFISYLLILSFLIIKYGKLILTLLDTFVDQIFVAIYFPNLITYICMVVVAILLMIFTIFTKKLKGFIRICNIFSFTVILFLFILTIDLINKSGLDVYDKTILYSNETLMILIQASMATFVVWVSLLIINLVITLFSVKVERNALIIDNQVTEVEYLSDEDYHESFVNYNQRKKYQEYLDISDEL